MSTPNPSACVVCSKQEGPDVKISQCSTCKARTYCGRACQVADWPTHKTSCKKPTVWYDKHRKCRDGSKHEGRLELITWDCPKEETGWAHCIPEEGDYMKNKFYVEYGGSEERFHKYWPQGFRWTCCGTDAGMDWGCDHHGTGSKPCTCDFCRMGKPLPEKLYKEQSASRMGLQLPRGPDLRSFNPAIATLAATGRDLLGLDM